MPERDMPNISEPEQPNHKLGITWDGGDESRVQALMAENERLREAIREHRAQVVMGIKSAGELPDADEALWATLDA